jgi:hypothetical protein
MTWELAASGLHLAAAVSAGQHFAGAVHLSARTCALGLLVLLIVAALYMAGCRIWPYGPCLACRSAPRRNPGSSSRRHGRCRVCKGTGERLRVGTRIWLATTNGRLPRGVRR